MGVPQHKLFINNKIQRPRSSRLPISTARLRLHLVLTAETFQFSTSVRYYIKTYTLTNIIHTHTEELSDLRLLQSNGIDSNSCISLLVDSLPISLPLPISPSHFSAPTSNLSPHRQSLRSLSQMFEARGLTRRRSAGVGGGGRGGEDGDGVGGEVSEHD